MNHKKNIDKLILATNNLEHRAFPKFVSDSLEKHDNACVAIMGDLLNIFPEPGEDLKNAMFYEFYGDLLITEMDRLVETGFKQIDKSFFVESLKSMFWPNGKYFEESKQMGRARYKLLFDNMELSLKNKSNQLDQVLICPGNMDYPELLHIEASRRPWLKILDQDIWEQSGVKIASVGGNPNDAHPFRGVVEISPYEMHPAEYARRLSKLEDIDILLTHITPIESKELGQFVSKSNVQYVISRAPFNFKAKPNNYRGQLEVKEYENKKLIFTRPFDSPKNDYFIVCLAGNIQVEKFFWEI